ncbi:unnamed protein product [Blepharisma stoltei]|uniref:Uncharacterized protein n=1 Tax=Blepharisma stoltei TaxID=1481888 RepID=A0AAU9K4C6_9CILI|nr:unnamed protein product [Blepharisma stoltei]
MKFDGVCLACASITCVQASKSAYILSLSYLQYLNSSSHHNKLFYHFLVFGWSKGIIFLFASPCKDFPSSAA